MWTSHRDVQNFTILLLLKIIVKCCTALLDVHITAEFSPQMIDLFCLQFQWCCGEQPENIHYPPPPDRIFDLYPHPSGKFQFSSMLFLSSFFLCHLLPLGISTDLPWGRYRYGFFYGTAHRGLLAQDSIQYIFTVTAGLKEIFRYNGGLQCTGILIKINITK